MTTSLTIVSRADDLCWRTSLAVTLGCCEAGVVSSSWPLDRAQCWARAVGTLSEARPQWPSVLHSPVSIEARPGHDTSPHVTRGTSETHVWPRDNTWHAEDTWQAVTRVTGPIMVTLASILASLAALLSLSPGVTAGRSPAAECCMLQLRAHCSGLRSVVTDLTELDNTLSTFTRQQISVLQ